jgi:hypothetical protein
MTMDADHSWPQAALAYAARGWCVLPLYGVSQGRCSCAHGAACTSPGKHPLIDDWPHTASRDPAQIRAWGQAWPTANIAVLTGVRSHLAVLDTDPRHGGSHTLADLEASYTPLPETPMVMSGGDDHGDHRYFFLDAPLGKYNPGVGLNLQADNAYVVAPPSQHASGRPYVWEASSEPDDLPLAPLPDWLKALGRDHAAATAAAVTLPDDLPAVDIRTLPVSTRVKYIIQTGEDPQNPTRFPSRSEALFTVMVGLVGAGCDDATIAAVVMNRRHAISEKVWDQKNPKSPTYEAQTRQWLAGDIGRARAHVAQRHPPGGPTEGTRALVVALRLLRDAVCHFQGAGVQDLMRQMVAGDPPLRLWFVHQLRRHQLNPALVWKAVGLPEAPTVSGLRTLSTPPHPGGAPWQVS